MNRLKEFLSLKSPSFLNIILPYIAFNWSEMSNSLLVNIENFIILFCILILIEIFIKFLINKRYYAIFLALTLFLFYGNYAVSLIQNDLDIKIRGRIVITFLLFFLLIVLFLLNRKLKNYKILNIYFLVFSAVLMANQLYTKKKFIDINKFKNNFIAINNSYNSKKPIVLIITDEYTSPDALFKIYRDSSIYNFSNKLILEGWQVKNSFYSYETSTIHSLSSLFNFNLSKNNEYKNIGIDNLATKKLMHAAIYDSLQVKKISIINYGIFDVGESKPLNRLYFYSRNIFEIFLKNTLLFPIYYNTGLLERRGFAQNYYPMEEHNKYIINYLIRDLIKKKDSLFFSYVHLYMPHSPMQFNPDFSFLNISTNNYFKYWKFTNKKLDSLLNSLIQENKFRIIVTGDHGFRSDKRIDPHYTFTAFYGFDSATVSQIKTVQDIGSLINSSY